MPPVGVRLLIEDNHVRLSPSLSSSILLIGRFPIAGDIAHKLLGFCRYWDLVWNAPPSSTGIFDVIKGTKFEIIKESEDQVEISFTRTWESTEEGKAVPLNIDKRFIMLRGSSGFYSYAIYEHSRDWPAFSIGETRIAFKLRKDKFHYMAIADDRQRYMPLPDDRSRPRGQQLAYPEAVLLVNPIEPSLRGEVAFLYPQAIYTDCQVFVSSHYTGDDLAPRFEAGEEWKKVFGPVFVYCNSAFNDDDDPVHRLWEDAKSQAVSESSSWPYSFVASEDFPACDRRGNVGGRLLVRDSYIDDGYIPANGAYVGLAPPGDAGSWQRECKGYQFWSRADEQGFFLIENIHEGEHDLYAWVPGFVGDYKYDALITITPGCDIHTGDLVFEPPRNGPTLWEIGVPDRSAAEFYVPDPNPKYINRLYVDHPDKFRQYGLWERYAELYPDSDLVYTVGISDYRKDWFFAQVTRKKDDKYDGTTWQIQFKLDNPKATDIYTLRVALASATLAELQVHSEFSLTACAMLFSICKSSHGLSFLKVRVNNPKASPVFSSGLIGRDNSIARHGIHGLYWLFGVEIGGASLVDGDNNIFLTQPRSLTPFQGIMYDYIRLEGPPSSSSSPTV
ncbi:hypothetical protein SAY86_022340 [Trapa natans]|uniref:Rhamnogalacturonan endolyase n=1 Tax=Trapa natans TaxID=22666 RepID=A0AAN7M8Y0_TRANT|nr:hypothetical protein SAY86_022340 [Trapa natans]